MKKTLTAQEIRDSFVENALITEKSMAINDYKTNNKAVEQLVKLFKVYENDIDLARDVLVPLLDSNSNVHIKCWVSTHCLVLNICAQKAEKILEEISKEKSQLGFSAEMVLEQWKKGELKVYRK